MLFLSVFAREALPLPKMLPMVSFHQCPMWDTWKKRVATVMMTPVPISSTRPILTQTKPLMASLTAASLSKKFSMGFFPFTVRVHIFLIKQKTNRVNAVRSNKSDFITPKTARNGQRRKKNQLCPFA